MMLASELREAAARILTDRCALGANGCVEYTRALTTGGYGQIRIPGQSWSAHRLAWTLTHGNIPSGNYVCHSCDNPRCVNPEHLFLGTATDNNRDMARKGRLRHNNKGRTHCRHGHEFVTGSYYVRKDTGARCCLVCDREKRKARRRGTPLPSVWP